jgi:hypothetical protein
MRWISAVLCVALLAVCTSVGGHDGKKPTDEKPKVVKDRVGGGAG